MNRLESVKRLFVNAYYIGANILLILFALIIFSHALWIWRLAPQNRDFASTLTPQQRVAYSHMTDAQINEVLNGAWENPEGTFEYEQWVGFREAPRRSRYVNVNEFGFRENGSEKRDAGGLNGSIWMLGGSTTFGYGVADTETIPSLLERQLGEKVYNFGRGYYYSAQENQLLRQLLKAGYRPQRVVFLDGINEACDIDVYQSSMKELFKQAQSSYAWTLSHAVAPVLKLVNKIAEKINPPRQENMNLQSMECDQWGVKHGLDYLLRENLAERRSLCAQYAIQCMTFVQPFAGLHGVHDDFKTLSAERRTMQRKRFDLLSPVWKASGASFVTDALDDYKLHAYVDSGHYGYEASKRIAAAMARRIRESRAQ